MLHALHRDLASTATELVWLGADLAIRPHVRAHARIRRAIRARLSASSPFLCGRRAPQASTSVLHHLLPTQDQLAGAIMQAAVRRACPAAQALKQSCARRGTGPAARGNRRGGRGAYGCASRSHALSAARHCGQVWLAVEGLPELVADLAAPVPRHGPGER
jgi:hypothetical protein